MKDRSFLAPHPSLDTAALEEEIRELLAGRQLRGQVGETLMDLVYRGRIDYGASSGTVMTSLRSQLEALLRMAPLHADFVPVSAHRGVGPFIERLKGLAVWAVRGLVTDVAHQQQAINQVEAVILDQLVAALQDKVDRRAPLDAYGFDRAEFFASLQYPEPFPARTVGSLVKPGATVWELGAGIGEVLSALGHAQALGVEISPTCVVASERQGLTVVHEDILDFLDERQGITADVAVLSRVADEMDPGTLARVLSLLHERIAPGGTLLIVSGPPLYIGLDILAPRPYPYPTLLAFLRTLGYSVETRLLHENGIIPYTGLEPPTWYALQARPTGA